MKNPLEIIKNKIEVNKTDDYGKGVFGVTDYNCENCGAPLLKRSNYCIKCGQEVHAAFKLLYDGERRAQAILSEWNKQRSELKKLTKMADSGEIKEKVESLIAVVDKIMHQVKNEPDCIKYVSKLTDTFIPMFLNTFNTFVMCCEIGVTNEEEMERLNDSVNDGLSYILKACYSIINNINQDDMISASLDIDIMKNIMQQEGLIESEQ